MESSLEQFPDLATTKLGLTSVFRDCGLARSQVKVLHREPFSQMSTFPCEIITCQLGESDPLQVLCKYSNGASYEGFHPKHHKGGIPYESYIYSQVLQPLSVSTPFFYGDFQDINTGRLCLVIEYRNKAVNINTIPWKVLQNGSQMRLAARWIGQFHAQCESFLSSTHIPNLKTYNAEYYRVWAQHTLAFAGEVLQDYPWVKTVCNAWEKLVNDDFLTPLTIVHGEYYAENILCEDERVYPVDWESAAIGIGEIDLAFLTQFYPREIVLECENEYQQARWPDGTPPEFKKKLAMARLYNAFRWLGDRQYWNNSDQDSRHWLFKEIRIHSERLGII